MNQTLRITRNRQSEELWIHIQHDATLMAAFGSAVRKIWNHYRDQFVAAGRATWDPSPLVVLPTTDLIIALIRRKVAALEATPDSRQHAAQLDALLRTAGLYAVADEILQSFLPEYRPMTQNCDVEWMDRTDGPKRRWWQFW